MDLIERYVHQVGRYLPGRLRGDVEAELRSLLTESLEERSRASGRPVDPAMASEVLKEFGRPREVASRYSPHEDYLIGPTLYPVYRRVVKVVVPACAAVTLALMVFGKYREAGQPASLAILVRATGSFLQGLLYNIGIITLVFVLVERAMRRGESQAASWDPSRLPPVDDPDRISYFGRVFLLYCIAAVALVFNFFPDWVAVVAFHDSDVNVFPLLEPGFSRYLPVLNAAWIAVFVLGLLVLREGRWTRTTRWIEFALDALNVGIVTAIILGPPVFHYDGLTKLALRGFLIVLVIRAGVALYRLLTRRPTQPWDGVGVSTSPPAE